MSCRLGLGETGGVELGVVVVPSAPGWWRRHRDRARPRSRAAAAMGGGQAGQAAGLGDAGLDQAGVVAGGLVTLAARRFPVSRQACGWPTGAGAGLADGGDG